MSLKTATIAFILVIMCEQPLAANVYNEPILPIPEPQVDNPLIVEIGDRLFHDVRLSGDNTISCSSCHGLMTGGVDGQVFSTGISGQKGGINSPTVFNSSLNIRQFWDGRALDLLEQVDGPVNNKIEMGSSWKQVVDKLKQDTDYLEDFKLAFPGEGLTVTSIKIAIVAFENSLLTPNSRFDQYLLGNNNAITKDELAGYKLFKQYGCVSCHQGRAVGGNLFQKLGVMKDFFVGRKLLNNTYLGRFNITGKESDRFVFKVPTLRNVALTAPYLHDGSVKTMAGAVEVMMVYQLGASPSIEDIQLIVKFLKTLTGEYQGRRLE